MLLRRKSLVEHSDLVDYFGDVEFCANEIDLITGAAHVGEYLVDHVEQLLSATHDAGDAIPLLGIELPEHPVAQYLGVGDDSSERRPQVVRDVREELRLERVTNLQLVDGALRLLDLRLERFCPLFQGGWFGRVGHAHIVLAVTSVANASLASVSASTASSSCWRRSSDQYRPRSAISSACRPCSTTEPRSRTMIHD